MITVCAYRISSLSYEVNFITFNEKYMVACVPWHIDEFERNREEKLCNGYLLVIESRSPNHTRPIFEKYFIKNREYEQKIRRHEKR